MSLFINYGLYLAGGSHRRKSYWAALWADSPLPTGWTNEPRVWFVPEENRPKKHLFTYLIIGALLVSFVLKNFIYLIHIHPFMY